MRNDVGHLGDVMARVRDHMRTSHPAPPPPPQTPPQPHHPSHDAGLSRNAGIPDCATGRTCALGPAVSNDILCALTWSAALTKVYAATCRFACIFP